MTYADVLEFDIPGIQRCQQNRYPVLFLDHVTVYPNEEKVRAVAVKNVTYNEWYMPAHFEDEPNVPGFIQTEIMAQTLLMTFLFREELQGKKPNALNYVNVKFRRQIVPGDQLKITAVLDSYRRGIAKGHVESYVGDELATSAEFVVGIPDVMEEFMPKR